MRRSYLALLVMAAMSGACSSMTTMRYDVGLTSVQRPAAARQRFGPQAITPVKDSAGKYRFEDQLISATFAVATNHVDVVVQNKTEYPIQISWNEAAFVDPKGQSHAVMHVGTKYSECTSPNAPSVIVAKGMVTDEITPCNYVHLGTFGWEELDYLPDAHVLADVAADTAKALARRETGTQLQLILPFKIEDVVNDYTFKFQVLDVTPRPRP